MSTVRPAGLVIAGSDSSGGAGLLRDLRVLADFDVDALCALTAVTAQSNTQVTAVHHLPPAIVRQQITAAFATRPICAVKIGMLGAQSIVEAVLATLIFSEGIPIVLDPVLVSSSGGALLDEAGLVALREQLLPRVTLVTPNIPEAAALLHEPAATNETGMIEQAERILRLGPQAVLIKGGHATGLESLDLLITDNQPPLRLSAPRIHASMRGTGCALASAIAATLAWGVPLVDACRSAKHFVYRELTIEGKATSEN